MNELLFQVIKRSIETATKGASCFTRMLYVYNLVGTVAADLADKKATPAERAAIHTGAWSVIRRLQLSGKG